MIFSFEGLRGICALIIALSHFGAVVLNAHLFSRPALAVEVFFLISGFVLAKVYSANISKNSCSFKSFLSRRFFRLYPLHLFCLITLLLFYTLSTLHFNVSEYGVWCLDGFPIINDNRNYADGYLFTFLINLFFLQGTGLNATDATWVYPSWSVSAEFFVCLLMYPLYRYCTNKVRLFFIIFLIVFAYLNLITHVADLGRHSFNFYGFLSIGLLRVLGGFFLGVLIFELSLVIKIDTKKLSIKVIESLLVIGIIYIIFFLKVKYIDYFALFLIVPMVLIFSSDLSIYATYLSNKLMVKLGTFSYSIYLNHVLVIGLFQYFELKIMLVNVLGNTAGFTLCILLFVFVVLILSFLTNKLIEKPSREKLYKLDTS